VCTGGREIWGNREDSGTGDEIDSAELERPRRQEVGGREMKWSGGRNKGARVVQERTRAVLPAAPGRGERRSRGKWAGRGRVESVGRAEWRYEAVRKYDRVRAVRCLVSKRSVGSTP